MIRLSKLADYGIVIMTTWRGSRSASTTRRRSPAQSHVPLPMASKILKVLARAGLLAVAPGRQGRLWAGAAGGRRSASPRSSRRWTGRSRSPRASRTAPGECEIEPLCPARANWQRINDAIRDALDGITLAEMAQAIPRAFGSRGRAAADAAAGALAAQS